MSLGLCIVTVIRTRVCDLKHFLASVESAQCPFFEGSSVVSNAVR